MFSFFKAWGPVGLAFLIACGGSGSTAEPGAGTGGSTGTSVTSNATSVTTGPGPITGVGTTGGAGGSGGAAGASGSGGAAGAGDAIALLGSQLQQDTRTWLEAGEELHPSTLVIGISTQTHSCAAPNFSNTFRSETLVVVGLPEAMQKPGTYAFSSTDVIAWGFEWLGDGMGNGGGYLPSPLHDGTIEVLTIDASSIDVRLSGVRFSILNDRMRTAVRCP